VVLCHAQEVLPVFATSDAEQLRLAVTCCNGLPRLVATVLSARKRARDWQQIEYRRQVQAVLLVSAAALRPLDIPLLDPGCRMRASSVLISCDAMAKVAAAASEVSQLLLASHDCGQQVGQQQLQQLACDLLAWWVAAHSVCAITQQQQQLGPRQDRSLALRSFDTVHFLSQSAELAAALAQTLSADSPQEQIAGLLEAAGYLCSYYTPVQTQKHSSDLLQLYSSPAYLQLSLAMLLLHSYSAQQAVSTTGSAGSKDVASDCSNQGNVGGSSTTSASSSGSDRSCGGAAKTSQHEPAQQQEQLEQLAKITKQLWQGAGLAPALLPRCAAALASQLLQRLPPAQQCDSGQQLQSQCLKYGYGFADMANALCRSLGMNVMNTNKLQPPQQPQGWGSTAAGHQAKQRPAAAGGLSFEQVPRQYQQLLQSTVWLLPQFLLQSALLCFDGSMVVAEAAAGCAQTALFWWCMTGMDRAAVFAAAAAAAAAQDSGNGSSSRTASRVTDTCSTVPGPLDQLVPPLVDVWLLLTKRVLLQQPGGLVHRAAATEQHLPVGSELAQQVRGSAYCGCLRHEADTRAQKLSASCEVQCHRFVTLSCEAQYALGTLLAALHQTAITSTAMPFEMEVPGHDFREHAHSVALVLEVVARKLLPHYTLCSSNSGSSTPGPRSCGSGISSMLSKSHRTESGTIPGLHAANAAPYLWIYFSRCMSEVLSGHGLVVLLYEQCNSRQLFSLMASVLKLWRCQPESEQQLSVLNSAGGVAAMMAKCHAKMLSLQRDGALAGDPGISQARESLSPWLLLLALYFSAAGQWLVMQMRGDAPVSPMARHLSRKLDEIVDTLRLLRMARDALQRAHDQWREAAAEAVQKQQDGCFLKDAAEQADHVPSMSAGQQPGAQQQTAESQGQPQQPQEQSQQQSQQQGLPEPPAPTAVADVAGPGYQFLEQLLAAIADDDLKDCQIVMSAAAAHAATLAGPTAVSMASGGRFGSSSTSTSSGLCSWLCDDATMSAKATSDSGKEVLAATNSIKAAQTLEQCWQATTGVKLLQRQAVSLRLEGVRLSNNLPVAWLCNNVNSCRNMAGARELQLVGGSSCVCGSCKVAR